MIQIKVEPTNFLYTFYFADQTGDFPVNKAIQGMGMKNQYMKWLGALLIMKKKHLIACDKNDTYIPKAIDSWLVCSG